MKDLLKQSDEDVLRQCLERAAPDVFDGPSAISEIRHSQVPPAFWAWAMACRASVAPASSPQSSTFHQLPLRLLA